MDSFKIKLEINNELLAITPLVVRDVRYKLDNGDFEKNKEVQFQLRNVSESNV